MDARTHAIEADGLTRLYGEATVLDVDHLEVAQGEAVRREQRLRAGERVAQRAEGRVDGDRALEGHAPLARGRLHVAVGVQRAGEVTVALLERGGQGPDHPVHPAIAETRYIKSLTCRLLPNS